MPHKIPTIEGFSDFYGVTVGSMINDIGGLSIIPRVSHSIRSEFMLSAFGSLKSEEFLPRSKLAIG